MLKKHQIVEQAVEDYAEAVHQLSKTSRGLVAEGHPERYGCLNPKLLSLQSSVSDWGCPNPKFMSSHVMDVN